MPGTEHMIVLLDVELHQVVVHNLVLGRNHYFKVVGGNILFIVLKAFLPIYVALLDHIIKVVIH